MPPFLERFEAAIGWLLFSIRGHDAKLFTKTPSFQDYPTPTITVTSPECGESGSQLQLHHTPLGANQFPQLKWTYDITAAAMEGAKIAEYIVVIEDPDAPLLMPVVHGIYYAIPESKTELHPEDFRSVSEAKSTLSGGFKMGSNRRKNIWSGPKPVLGHGQHRYMFQVVALKSSLEGEKLSGIPTRAELESAIRGKVVGWGMWVGTYERASG